MLPKQNPFSYDHDHEVCSAHTFHNSLGCLSQLDKPCNTVTPTTTSNGFDVPRPTYLQGYCQP